MALPTTKTDMCNLSLSRIGAKAVTTAQLTADTDVRAQHCNRHYEQTRDAMLRSLQPRCAIARSTLVKGSVPAFGYDHNYKLPDDFLGKKTLYDSDESDGVFNYQYDIEGKLILTDEDTCQIVYVRRVTDVTEFDPLFVEVLTLALALKLVMPLTQDRKLYAEIKQEYKDVVSRVRTLDKQETNTVGRGGTLNWNESRY